MKVEEFKHYSVLLKETVDALNVKQNGVYVDGTLGGGGHSEEILKRLNNSGKLIAIDRDEEAIAFAKTRLSKFKNVEFYHNTFSEINQCLQNAKIESVDGVVLDLGVSSYQIDTFSRGFSYKENAPLDMRMDKTQVLSAETVLNTYTETELFKIIRDYGEENFAKLIAKNICLDRKLSPLKTSDDLKKIIDKSIPAKLRFNGSSPYKRTFQAIRIEVNNELKEVEEVVTNAFNCLNKGGRLAIITFHSLEDRIVKQKFAGFCEGCICKEYSPVCICHKTPQAKIVGKKFILPGEGELNENSRSASSKLRVIEKL